MSRKLESIDIEVNERKGTSAPTWEVIIPGKRSIGIIEQEAEEELPDEMFSFLNEGGEENEITSG